eukprot:54696-Eustigmatos_ZCMA.PRE.1
MGPSSLFCVSSLKQGRALGVQAYGCVEPGRCEENNKRIVGRWGRWFRPDWYDKDVTQPAE